MPKKKPEKKFAVKAPNVFPLKSKNRFKIILGFIALCFLIFLVVRQVHIYQQKADYREAEAVLEDIYRQIETDIGKPDKIERGKECFYSSAKFSKGTLSCSVSIRFSQSIDDATLANNKANQIIATLNKDARLRMGGSSRIDAAPFNNINRIDLNNKELYYGNNPSMDFFIPNNTRGCGIDFQYLSPDRAKEFKSVVVDNRSNKLVVFISCGGEAKSEYFPAHKF